MTNPSGWKPSMEKSAGAAREKAPGVARERVTGVPLEEGAQPAPGAVDEVGAGGATRGLVYEERLLFERGSSGRSGASLPPRGGAFDPAEEIPRELLRAEVEGLQREMTSYLERGYSVVKMKIGGASLAEDCERIESVTSSVRCESRSTSSPPYTFTVRSNSARCCVIRLPSALLSPEILSASSAPP